MRAVILTNPNPNPNPNPKSKLKSNPNRNPKSTSSPFELVPLQTSTVALPYKPLLMPSPTTLY